MQLAKAASQSFLATARLSMLSKVLSPMVGRSRCSSSFLTGCDHRQSIIYPKFGLPSANQER